MGIFPSPRLGRIPRVVAGFRIFNLQNIRAHIRHLLAAKRPRNNPRKIQNLDADKRRLTRLRHVLVLRIRLSREVERGGTAERG
jgi:hypothetical protein